MHPLQKNKIWNAIALNTLLWLVLYLFWVFVFRNTTLTVTRTLQIQFCYLVFIAANYYFNIYYAIPKLLNRKRYGTFVVLVLAFLFVSTWMRAGVVLFINATFYHIQAAQINFSQLYTDSLVNITAWSVGLIAVKLLLDRAQFEQRALVMEKEKVKSELDFLRAQNNPHFLFNALNSVYFQIDKNNRNARESLMVLSEILRYQLYDCNSSEVPVEKEISFLKNYVQLQQLRLNENYKVEVAIDGTVKNFMLAPLLIMPLVENAFKYVSHFSGNNNEIAISLSFAKGLFSCFVSNTVEREVKTSENSGIGLKNLKRRLELLYNNSHKLITENTGEIFTATLILQVHEN